MNKDYIIENLKKQILNADTKLEIKKIGRVIEVGDGVAKVIGLDGAMMSEMIKFESADKKANDVYGVVMNSC